MGFHPWRASVKTWKVTKPSAKSMRHLPTKEEALLWERLRDRQIAGAKFRRQHGIGPCIADFCCPEAMLVVEVDGPIHDDPEAHERDAEKDANLAANGFKVLRFSNEQVTGHLDSVVAAIASALSSAGAG